MTGTIRERFNDTRNKLDVQRERVRNEITHRKDDLVARSRRLRLNLDKRRDVALGRLRDGGLERLYGASEQALLRAAQLVERAEHAAPKRVHALEGQASKLRERAARLEDARGELSRPPIPNYDDMNVADVNRAVAELSPYQLQKLRAYESEHKNRVTVLREIDRQLGEDLS